MRIYGQDLDRAQAGAGWPAIRALWAACAAWCSTTALERGIRALEFRTGSGLAFDVLVDRAMDIGPAEHAGRSFGWRSATGLRHPSLHEYRDEDGLAWLRSFSGLVVTAGLDHTLFTAEVDATQYRYPFRTVGLEWAARPCRQHSCPTAGLWRRVALDGHLHPVGRRRGAPGGGLRRASAPPPAHRGRSGRQLPFD